MTHTHCKGSFISNDKYKRSKGNLGLGISFCLFLLCPLPLSLWNKHSTPATTAQCDHSCCQTLEEPLEQQQATARPLLLPPTQIRQPTTRRHPSLCSCLKNRRRPTHLFISYTTWCSTTNSNIWLPGTTRAHRSSSATSWSLQEMSYQSISNTTISAVLLDNSTCKCLNAVFIWQKVLNSRAVCLGTGFIKWTNHLVVTEL